MDFQKHLANAKTSSFGLKKLNFGLARIIPFNRPHGIKIRELKDDSITTIIPYKRKNMNHIKGVHACGLATCAEFASGFLLLSKLNAKEYRLIMQSLDMEYHYQAKSDVVAKFEAQDSWIEEHVLTPLNTNEKVLIQCEINLYDSEKNHVATARTNWQIKRWKNVKTKL
jgi:acyl-coenzyme A thioesterase PaaI-like protein